MKHNSFAMGVEAKNYDKIMYFQKLKTQKLLRNEKLFNNYYAFDSVMQQQFKVPRFIQKYKTGGKFVTFSSTHPPLLPLWDDINCLPGS
jgi:hypothetical protein